MRKSKKRWKNRWCQWFSFWKLRDLNKFKNKENFVFVLREDNWFRSSSIEATLKMRENVAQSYMIKFQMECHIQEKRNLLENYEQRN
jgi:hypothetical protein